MLSELKKFFGDNIEIGIIKEKPKLPLFLAMRNIYKVKINGICFMLIESGSDEKFGIKAFKKQIAIYEEVFQLHASFLFSDITRAQRDALIKNNIPFIKFPDQIYLPFFGIMLSNKIKGDKTINAEKMMPVTQQLYLYMLYKKSTCIPKYKAAEDLGCSRTSITRASSQLIIMGLITQKKQGKNAFMELKHSNKESLKKAGPYLINPIKNIITIRREDLPDSYFYAGESALSEYSMLNPPPIPEVAVYKDSFIAGNIIKIEADADLQRDVFIAGAEVEISGNIGRDVTIYATKVTFKGAVIQRNVNIYASSISADEKTKLNGNLSYPEDADVNIDEDIVSGKITKTEVAEDSSNGFVTVVMSKFWSFMALMLVFAFLSLVASKLFTRIEKEYDKFDFNKGLEVFTKGLVFMILVPVIIFVLFLMSIGIPLALIFLALYFIVMYLSTMFTGYLIGYKLWQKFFNKDINMLVVGIFGLAILFVLNLIPGISIIVSILTVFIGTGIIYDVILKKIGSSD